MSENSDSKCETGEKAISVSALTKKFNKITALEGVSFEVKKGEIFGMLGPDGAGKTTLMRILAGLMPFDRGRVSVLGRDLSKISGDLCDHIAYMPQRFGLYPDLSVIENIMFYADLYDMKRGRELDGRIDELLEFCRMSPFKNRFAGRLSGGMKQKLGLTCALIHTPALLFLDEPTNGVDPVSRREFWKILHDMRKGGLTIFVSTTYLDEAERCNQIAFINQGRIGQIDTPQNLKKSSKNYMWHIETSDKFGAIEIIKKLPGIVSAIMMGPAIHIFASPELSAETLRETLANRLGAAKIKLDVFKETSPSLEDIFIEQMSAKEA